MLMVSSMTKGAMQCFGSLVTFIGYDIMFYVLPRIILV